MSKKDFSVALKYVEARPRSQRRKGTEARVSGISVVGSGASATDLSLLQANLISVTNNFTALKDLFDSMFEKDSDGNIHAKLSLWSSGGITAGEVGSGGSGGGGGISYNRLDSWSDYTADKAGYVLSAALGKDLDSRVSALANAGYVTASALAPYALRSELPIITKDGLKSTLGISDWALASAKPTYTASEVGALGVNDTATNANKLGGYLPTTYMRASGQYTDSLNDLTSLGIYRMSGTIKDGPTGAGGYGNLMVVRSNSWDTLSQLYFNANNNRIFVRSGTNSNFTSKDWATIAFTSDIPTKLSDLTDDVVVGKYLPLSGGKLVYSGAQGIEAERTDGAPSHIMFIGLVNGTSRQLGGFGMNGYNDPVYVNPNGIRHKVLTAENYSNLLAGGTINGGMTFASGNLIVSNGHTVVGELYPKNDGSIDLGQGSRKWKDVYLGGYLTWGNSVDSTDIGDWEALKGNTGLRIISSKTSDSGAPYQYATALHVRGRYGFELAVQGGDIDSFAIRSVVNNRGWNRLLHSGNYSDYITNSYLKSTLGISDWALASAKPTYTASEVGALSVNGGTVNGSITATSFTGVINSVAPKALFLSMSYTAGQYSRSVSEEDGKIFIGSSANNNVISSPKYDGTNTVQNIQSLKLAYNSAFFTEIATTPNSDHLWKRNVNSSTANPWERFVTEKAGVIWNISITGNADSANKLHLKYFASASQIDDTYVTWIATGPIKDVTSMSYATLLNVGGQSGRQWQIWNNRNNGLLRWRPEKEDMSDWAAERILLDTNNYNSLITSLTYLTSLTVSGNVSIGGTNSNEKLYVHGNGKFTGTLLSQALRSAGISIGCDSSGVASDNYAREINTFANKLYLQYRGGDIDLCGNGGTTYLGGALEGKTANFTSLTSPSITANSLTIGVATITYDSVNEALCINGNMYALGGITAGGAGISAYTSLEARVARIEQQLNI